VSPPPIVCFGEILWDCLPRGLFLGGAPFNVACHLARLGRRTALISAVGADFLGDEARRRAHQEGVDTAHLARLPEIPTGVVQVQVAAGGRAVYDFSAPAAWDFIPAGAPERTRVGDAAAFVYGSLATRSAASRATLESLLAVPGPFKVFDVNLRPPHDDHARVRALARHAGLVKLNAEELSALAGRPFAPEDDPRPLLQSLRDDTGVTRWCVTLGARGAAWWQGGEVVRAAAPSVTVRDTVGAGDAFLAALVDALTLLPQFALSAQNPRGISALLARACRLGALVAGRDGACPEYRIEEID
jgi:fructokinase